MIIFCLDGTLADCEHRRHFVDPSKNNIISHWDTSPNGKIHLGILDENRIWKEWKPKWKSFYELCYQDKPIPQVIEIWNDQISLGGMGQHQIWSGRCESVRKKTEQWLDKHLLCFDPKQLKMRPIGDNTPDDQLKERWLNEEVMLGSFESKTLVDCVFDSDPASIAMYRRRGIFVFDVNQNERELDD